MAIEKVLIVDDSPTEQHFISGFLKKHGLEVITANNGEQGISIAKSQLPDLILMDVVMPGMNGFQATRKLNRDPETKSIPVVIVSSKDEVTDRAWGMRQGAVDYIVKPVSESLLINKIRELSSV
ncbi:MAG: twitching motility two-component system response regulator PilH [Parasphingorhabdus sp.]|jgi:twitching motility two-component system response regulator PilH